MLDSAFTVTTAVALVTRAAWESVKVKPAAAEPLTPVIVVPPAMFGPPMVMPMVGVKFAPKALAAVITVMLPAVVVLVAVDAGGVNVRFVMPLVAAVVAADRVIVLAVSAVIVVPAVIPVPVTSSPTNSPLNPVPLVPVALVVVKTVAAVA